MTVQNGKNYVRADHRRHDRLLVTRFAMDDSYPGERDEARQLIDSCAECASLAADVRAIAASMKQLPAPARPRDFTISQEQADRLRGSGFAQLLRGLATPGWATLRPVAGVALSIGLVMAVVGSALPSYSPAGIPAGDNAAVRVQASAAPEAGTLAPAPRAASSQPLSAPAATAGAAGAQAPAASPGAAGGHVPAASAAAASGPPPADSQTDRSGSEAQPLPAATEDATTRDLNMAYLEQASPEPASNADDAGSTTLSPEDSPAVAAAVPADPTRSLLIYAGLAIAAISVAVLILAWSARRYFADPLLR